MTMHDLFYKHIIVATEIEDFIYKHIIVAAKIEQLQSALQKHFMLIQFVQVLQQATQGDNCNDGCLKPNFIWGIGGVEILRFPRSGTVNTWLQHNALLAGLILIKILKETGLEWQSDLLEQPWMCITKICACNCCILKNKTAGSNLVAWRRDGDRRRGEFWEESRKIEQNDWQQNVTLMKLFPKKTLKEPKDSDGNKLPAKRERKEKRNPWRREGGRSQLTENSRMEKAKMPISTRMVTESSNPSGPPPSPPAIPKKLLTQAAENRTINKNTLSRRTKNQAKLLHPLLDSLHTTSNKSHHSGCPSP
jgi:hypothetical protein